MQRSSVRHAFSMIALCAALGGPILAAPVAFADTATGDPVVAKVNGHEIHRSDVEAVYKNLPKQYAKIPFDQIYTNLLNQLIERRLAVQAAIKAGIEKDPAVIAKIASLKNEVLEDSYLDKAVASEVTDAKIKAKYDALIAANPPQEEVHARHILVDSEAEAKKIKAKLDKGADFATLANKYSKDSKDKSGGDLGFFTKDRMVPAFAKAAFAAKPGQIVGPIKTQFGWHLIQVVGRRMQPAAPFDKVKGQVRQILTRELTQKKLEALKAGAKIETFAADGSVPRPEIVPPGDAIPAVPKKP